MCIIFDLDDTLITTTRDLIHSRFLRISKLVESQSAFSSIYPILLQYNKLYKSSKDALKKFFESYPHLRNFQKSAYAILEQDLLSDENIHMMKGADKLLLQLRNEYELYIVSYGKKRFQFQKMKKAGVDTSLFIKIEITENPNKLEAYQTILKNKHVASECIAVGDRMRDLFPANALGMKTIHIRQGRGEFEKCEDFVDFSIDSIEELCDCLKNIKKG
ncbi:MAG TPA: HAD family hydrolase [Chlamydiales bacterium]|nr:HAD family hydrolase [Chlamydiales bacterium]